MPPRYFLEAVRYCQDITLTMITFPLPVRLHLRADNLLEV